MIVNDYIFVQVCVHYCQWHSYQSIIIHNFKFLLMYTTIDDQNREKKLYRLNKIDLHALKVISEKSMEQFSTFELILQAICVCDIKLWPKWKCVCLLPVPWLMWCTCSPVTSGGIISHNLNTKMTYLILASASLLANRCLDSSQMCPFRSRVECYRSRVYVSVYFCLTKRIIFNKRTKLNFVFSPRHWIN